MTVIYLVSQGVPERAGILGELPLERCIEEFGLDPSQRVHGLREAAAPFDRPGAALPDDLHQVVAGVGPEEATGEVGPGYYWLDITPEEARRRLKMG